MEERALQQQRQETAQAGPYQAAISAFAEVAGALGEVREQDVLLHLIAEKICELVGVERCSIYLKDERTGYFRGQVGRADHDIDARVKRLVAGVAADAFTREILETKAPVVIGDALHDPRPVRATMRAWNIRAMMGVPMVLRGDVIGLMFLDDEDRPHPFRPVDREIASTFADLAAVAIWQAQMTARLRSTMRTVARQNDMLRRATAIEDRLSKLVLDGGNLREIAHAVAQLTSKPCAIYDARCQRLALAHAPGLAQDAVPGIFDPQARADPQVADALAGLGTQVGVVGPFPSAGLRHRYLIAPVAVRDDCWGWIVVMEHQTRFGPLDQHVCRRAATNIALEMSAERRAANAQWSARASLAGELIRGPGDEAWLQRRADYLGIRLDVPRVLVLVTVGEGENQAVPEPRILANALSETQDELLATTVAEGVAVMLDLPQPVDAPSTAVRAARATVADALRQFDPDGRLIAGMSAICSSAGDYVAAYQQARQVVRSMQGARGAGAEAVLSADDLGAGRLLLASTDPAEAARFAAQTLGPLLTDAEGMADLMATLRAFFESGRSVRRAGTMLGVHENTVRYRLARVEELTGLPVATDTDAQLSAQISLLVLRVHGRLAEPDPADAPVSA